MILDNEEQRAVLLEMFDSIPIQGKFLDIAYRVKQSIVNAEIAKSPAVPQQASQPLELKK